MRQVQPISDSIRSALKAVIDPELGENVVDLGLIYAITAGNGGAVRIEMTTTARGCPAAAFLTQAVEACARQVPGVTDVEILLTYDPPWDPEMMSAGASARFGW